MTPNDTAEIAELIGSMAATFPSVQMGEESIFAYVRMLQDIPLPILTVAIEQCTAENKWLPAVAEIRDKAMALTAPQAPTALEAWKVVCDQMFKEGHMGRPNFGDPIIKRAVECLGWRELCNSENQVADRAHFSKVYDQLVARQEQDAKLLPAARGLKEATAQQRILGQIVNQALQPMDRITSIDERRKK